jgi:hypothetical protein
MKNTLLLIAGIVFYTAANAQTLTFADLVYLKTQKTAKAFLKSKGYKFVSSSNGLEMYHKNRGAGAEENVEFHLYKNKGFISYHTTDTAYVHAMEKTVSKSYKQILKDDNPRETFFRFGNSTTNIMIEVIKGPTAVGQISVGSLN